MISGPYRRLSASHPILYVAAMLFLFGMVNALAVDLQVLDGDLNAINGPVSVASPRKPSLPSPAPTASATQAGEARQAPITGLKGHQARVTWFSSAECRTTWCRANAGLPRGHKVALNARFGKVAKVYIPAWDQTYDVIGSTDQNTDVDIWCEGDGACQDQVASRSLLINLIP